MEALPGETGFAEGRVQCLSCVSSHHWEPGAGQCLLQKLALTYSTSSGVRGWVRAEEATRAAETGGPPPSLSTQAVQATAAESLGAVGGQHHSPSRQAPRPTWQ